jgi:hypothetical protein
MVRFALPPGVRDPAEIARIIKETAAGKRPSAGVVFAPACPACGGEHTKPRVWTVQTPIEVILWCCLDCDHVWDADD